MTDLAQLYEQDYTAWAEANTALLRAGDFERLPHECPYSDEQILDQTFYPPTS